MEQEYIFGKNIIENLTTGMYSDSKVIYREYIQNSCDQIDKAIQYGLLTKEDAEIEIWLDSDNRNITIKDNATGILSKDFKKILGNIADSDKKIGEDKGFRGIGRLCGLAYCKTLLFTSKAKEENIISIMEIDAKKMRELITNNDKLTANQVLHSVNKFREESCETDEHYFEVKLIGINEENNELLDKQKIIDYLSFVAPVPYQNTFTFRKKIYKYAEDKNFKIDQYIIKIDGEQIFKKYNTELKDDKIFDVEFKEFKDYNGNTLAWMWYGLSYFKQCLPKEVQMRGLRLRKENIQIGNEDALQKLFKEDRGNHYFVGEVFAISQNLIPNSQRSYFNENITRRDFEGELSRYFDAELKKMYYTGSKINSAFKSIDNVKTMTDIFSESTFANASTRQDEYKKIDEAKEKAEKAKNEIEKIKTNSSPVIQKIIDQIEKGRENTSEENKKINNTKKTVIETLNASKKERRLLDKIFSIIYQNADKNTAELIIQKIKEEFK